MYKSILGDRQQNWQRGVVLPQIQNLGCIGLVGFGTSLGIAITISNFSSYFTKCGNASNVMLNTGHKNELS